MKPCFASVLNGISLMLFCLATPRATGQQEIDIDRLGGGPKLIPIALTGFSGEILAVLKFDLEIQGFEITSADRAQYLVNGSNSSSLVGRVADRINKAVLLSKEYTGGTPRTQAHTFADDIVEKLAGRPGISRTKIAFKVETSAGRFEIFVADYDGHNAVQITRDGTINRDPAWVPGRRALYYTSYRMARPDIYSHDLQSGARQAFARYPGLNAGASISPDGRRVTMVLSKGGNPDVYVCDVDTRNLRQLTRTKEDESAPCWSPDGRAICFSSRASGAAALYTVPAGGGSMSRLRTGVANATEPDWSPDGKWIAFTRLAGDFEICVVPAGGGTAEPLVRGEDPSWAPNSRTIAFTRRVGGRRVVSLLDVPTKRWKDGRQLSGSHSQPAWAK